MAKKDNSTLSAVSFVLSSATVAIDSYNESQFNNKNKQLNYLSLGIGVSDMLLDFYLTFGAKSGIAKAWSLLSLGRQLKASLERYKPLSFLIQSVSTHKTRVETSSRLTLSHPNVCH